MINSRARTASYIWRKLGQFVLTLFALSLIVFFIARLTPGDPLRAFYGDAVERMGVEQLAAAKERLGLNDSLITQYINWFQNALHGDFGISFKYKQDVLSVIEQVYMNTLLLTIVCFVLIFILGLLLAIFCVRHEGRLVDRLICQIGVATNSIPEFFIALILIMIFAVNLGVLPSSGAYSVGQAGNLTDRLEHLVLPVLAIVISHLWYCAYLMRNKLSEEVRAEYVLLAKVKGLSQRRIIYTHCLKNIMPAVVSIMAIFLPHLLGGAYVIEMVFSFPGLGSLGFESAKYHDYNMLMVICLMTGVVVILTNMLAQVVNEKLDSRMAYEQVDFEEDSSLEGRVAHE